MNIQQRVVSDIRPWWKAVAEEPAHNRSASEWAETAMRPLKASFVLIGVALALGFAFHSDFAFVMAADGTIPYELVSGGLDVVLGITLMSGVVLGVKAAVAEYHEEKLSE